MIAKGLITQRANEEQLPAHTIERDYVLTHVCADIGAINDTRLVSKGGTLLRMCYFDDYRYSADLDFSSVAGLTAAEAVAIVGDAVDSCRRRTEMPTLEVAHADAGTALIAYVGPLGSRPRKIKLDISDTELIETQHRCAIQQRWPDLPVDAAIESYTLDEVGAEKLRCIAETVKCRDLYYLHELLDGQHIDVMEAWHLYLRKAANNVTRGRERTPPREWASAFGRRLISYRSLWDRELGDYLSEIPNFGDVERRSRRHLSPVVAAAQALTEP
ncbi:MAG: nucleotidyl transferase AbiEii/AbiGii toxin family protein [Acidimicrobiales bacterium]